MGMDVLIWNLVWATGFIFLIYWRGYWQELIETLAWASKVKKKE